MQGFRRTGQFRQAVAKPVKVGPEHNPWYWNPFRAGAVEAPAWFQEKLRDVDPDRLIDVRWSPIHEHWGVFYRNHRIQHPVCHGWTLLFTVPGSVGLDERVLARLYSASAQRWGNGKEYFLAVQREIERDREKSQARTLGLTLDKASEVFDHSQIKVGYGKSSGSKFSTYHS